MPDFSFITAPTAKQVQEIIELYRQAGWWSGGDAPEVVTKIITGSHCFVIAVAGGEIIGMGRAISDGVSDAYIQDVTVTKAHRGKGIATRIVTMILDRLGRDNLGWVAVIAENGSTPVYENLGFRLMHNSQPMIKTIYGIPTDNRG